MLKNIGLMALVAVLTATMVLPASIAVANDDLATSIISPNNAAVFEVGEDITFSGQATGGEAPYAFVWNFGDGTEGGGQNFTRAYSEAGDMVVTLTVTDFADSTSEVSHTITINEAPVNAPTVDLKVNNEDGPVTIIEGTVATLSWSTTDATECVASGAWSGDKSIGDSESFDDLVAGTYAYILTCTGFGGLANDSVTVNVEEIVDPTDTTPPTVPTITFASHNEGETSADTTAKISWTESADEGSGLAGYSFLWDHGSDTAPDSTIDSTITTYTQALGNGTWYFHIVALDNAGNVSSPVTHYGPITIEVGDVLPPVISNIRVTDITQTGATIRWDTDKPANSRVIYDTVSHSDISGESEPNFGYAFSSETLNEDPLVTEHAVTLTGLTADTQYFFRVLSR
ncbi:MAG: PKD domain-containing protein [Patescibacteria group bacterium]|nr:PKD domain-containing protein [Patescibacteria group bacterium]